MPTITDVVGFQRKHLLLKNASSAYVINWVNKHHENSNNAHAWENNFYTRIIVITDYKPSGFNYRYYTCSQNDSHILVWTVIIPLPIYRVIMAPVRVEEERSIRPVQSHNPPTGPQSSVARGQENWTGHTVRIREMANSRSPVTDSDCDC